MPETREIETADIVSVYTGVLVSSRLIDAIYDVCGWLLRDPDIMTHQLPAASRACIPLLDDQFPWLADLKPPRDIEALRMWLGDVEHEHGKTLTVTRPDDVPWIPGRALEDLRDMTTKPIVIIEVPDERA